MAKFGDTKPRVRAPITSTVPMRTAEGGAGYARDARSELFMLAVANMVGEDTFYEMSTERDQRFVGLIHQVTSEDPAWVRGFIPWLRETANMRSASVVAAAEYVAAGGPEGRGVIASALIRADEPSEMLGYWTSRFGRALPMPLKRGVSDAVQRLYTERNALKWDSRERTWRMGDVIELTHAKPKAAWQSNLFKVLIDRRHNRDNIELPETLGMLRMRAEVDALPLDARMKLTGDMLALAGYTWEARSSWGAMDAAAWVQVIPNMGYMALLRNLRNFEQAGVPDAVLNDVAALLSDPASVAQSRQFPFRFLSAWKAVKTMRFGPALEKALEASVANVPELPGRTLILIDCSASMWHPMSGRSEASRHEVAGIFGLALAKRAAYPAVYAYGNGHERIDPSGSVLRGVEKLHNMGGTQTWQTLAATYQGHDRVIIITDEQAFATFDYNDYGYGRNGQGDPGVDVVPLIYTWNVAGYEAGHNEANKPGRYAFAGLNDSAFRMLPLLESRQDGAWPWEASRESQ